MNRQDDLTKLQAAYKLIEEDNHASRYRGEPKGWDDIQIDITDERYVDDLNFVIYSEESGEPILGVGERFKVSPRSRTYVVDLRVEEPLHLLDIWRKGGRSIWRECIFLPDDKNKVHPALLEHQAQQAGLIYLHHDKWWMSEDNVEKFFQLAGIE